MRAPAHWRARLVLGGALLVILSFIYGSLANAELTNWDDDRFFTFNPLFRMGGWDYVCGAFTKIQFEAYQPIHLISYLPDHYLWPGWAPGFHLVNLALFALDIFVIWRLVRRHTSELAAFAAVALFALHPLCVEPVAWVTDRKDLLMLLWFLLALGREDNRAGARPDLGALGLYLCALLTKSSSVCFPIVLFAWLTWMRRLPLRDALIRSAGYAAAALVVSVIVFAVWRDHGMIVDASAHARATDVTATVVTFAEHVVWPADLAPVYPGEASYPIAALIVCVAAAIALAATWRRLRPRTRFAVVAVTGVLLPVSNLVPMTLRFSDRYLFVALAVLVLPVASALDELVAWMRTRGRPAVIASALGVAALAGLEVRASAALTPTWHGSRTLWEHAVAAQPRAFLSHIKYAEVLQDAHEWSAAAGQLRLAHELNLTSVVPLQQLFQLDAARAETAGTIVPGTAARWVDQLERAVADLDAFQQLAVEVDTSRCKTCSHALLVVQLTAWPVSDRQLLVLARQALDRRAADRARIYLAQVRDRTLPELAQLAALVDQGPQRP